MQTKMPTPPLHALLSALCLYIGRVIEGAVTGSLLLGLPLPGTLVVSRGGKKTRFGFHWEGQSVNHALSPAGCGQGGVFICGRVGQKNGDDISSVINIWCLYSVCALDVFPFL